MKKNIKNLAAGLTVALVFVVTLELILWLAGVEPLYERTDPYVGFSGYSPLFVESTSADGAKIYATADTKINWFNYQQFPVNKEEGVTRIFCLGGSTTYGRPYDDRTSFSGWLREFLPAVDPDKKWEVINAGGISYASYRVARLMNSLTRFEPDLFVIYTGHNEFLEKRTYQELLDTPEFIRDLASLASRLRIYTLLTDIITPRKDILATEVDAILDNSIGPEDYTRDDELRDAVIEHYEVSLERMTNIAEDEDAGLIFVTPASNIKDFSPFKSEPAEGLDSTKINQVEFLKVTIKGLLDNNNPKQASDLIKQALSIDPRDAELLYLKGKALYELEHYKKARTAFIAARDEDIAPLRALTPMPGIVADVAEETGSGLVDFAGMIKEAAPKGIPGKKLFLDHVHPTIESNRKLALEIINEMVDMGYVETSATWNKTTIEEITSRVKNSIDEEDKATALTNLSRVLNWAGKKEEALQLVERASSITSDQHTLFQTVSVLMSSGKYEEALPYAEQSAKLMPDIASVRKTHGIILAELGRSRKALKEFKAAAELNPELDEIYYHLGLVQSHLGNRNAAEINYIKAIEQDSKNADAFNNLGILYAQDGNLEQALKLFERAVKADPDHENAQENLTRARSMLRD